jgi:hypothetical protein
MSDLPADFVTAFARRVAERDQPRPLSQEPAAVQARLDAWLLQTHGIRNGRSRLRYTLALLALMLHENLHTSALGLAAGLRATAGRSSARLAGRLRQRGFTTWESRGQYRYHRLTRPTEDALLLLAAGKQNDASLNEE